MIAVGSCNGDVTSTIVQTIMEKNEQELKDTYARWLPLGLGLNHLGKWSQNEKKLIWDVFIQIRWTCGVFLDFNSLTPCSLGNKIYLI